MRRLWLLISWQTNERYEFKLIFGEFQRKFVLNSSPGKLYFPKTTSTKQASLFTTFLIHSLPTQAHPFSHIPEPPPIIQALDSLAAFDKLRALLQLQNQKTLPTSRPPIPNPHPSHPPPPSSSVFPHTL